MVKRAFTLLEMMLVIFLLAVAATFIAPTIMRPDMPPAQLAAEHFYGLLTQLRNKAQLDGQITGVRVDPRRYRFMHYAKGEWRSATLPRTATDVALPQTVQLTLQQGALEPERRLSLHDIQLSMQQSVEHLAPQVWFSPHEPPTPFSVQFLQSQPASCWQVALGVSGHIVLQPCTEGNA